jgi:hypothetical protein
MPARFGGTAEHLGHRLAEEATDTKRQGKDRTNEKRHPDPASHGLTVPPGGSGHPGSKVTERIGYAAWAAAAINMLHEPSVRARLRTDTDLLPRG